MPAQPPRGPAHHADDAWQDTQPGGLTPASRAVRQHPPLTEVLQGLDVRELEGQTVFDQLFGPPEID